MPRVVAEKIEWVKLGFQMFAQEGERGLVVDNMAKTLQCNRSSFYWHFKSKAVFIEAIIDYWIDIDTEQIIALTAHSGSAEFRFKQLVHAVFKKDPNIDFVFHMKRYALKHKAVQEIMDQIDEQRIAYTASILFEMGFSKADAEIKANIFYKYLIGYHEMIRYKNQSNNYVAEIYHELTQFITL